MISSQSQALEPSVSALRRASHLYVPKVNNMVRHMEPAFAKVIERDLPRLDELFFSHTLKIKNLESIRREVMCKSELAVTKLSASKPAARNENLATCVMAEEANERYLRKSHSVLS